MKLIGTIESNYIILFTNLDFPEISYNLTMINWPSMFPEWTQMSRIFSLKLANIILAESSFSGKIFRQKNHKQFQKLWLATDQIFKNGCTPTNFKTMVSHQPNFEKCLLTKNFQKLWLGTCKNFKNGCSPTNFKNFGWPPTKISKMVAHRPISKILVGHQPKSKILVGHQTKSKIWLIANQN